MVTGNSVSIHPAHLPALVMVVNPVKIVTKTMMNALLTLVETKFA